MGFLLVLKAAVSAFTMFILTLMLGVPYLAFTRQPDLDRDVVHPALEQNVHVIRDDWGIPHIQAENEADAYFALGYVMAQDRLFQMELLRRLARGELAEILGPAVVPVDKIIRAFRLRANAEATVTETSALAPEIRAAVDAFVAGINHCMDTEPLPLEFTVLQIPPRPFTRVDCLTVAAILPITFADGLREDPLVTMLKERNPDLDIDTLFPGYSLDAAPVTIMETIEEAEAFLKARAQTAAKTSQTQRELTNSMSGLRAFAADLQSLSDILGPGFGSNSWVLGPSRTKSGKPIVANDPHIPFTNPSIWYEAHLEYPGFEMYGHHLPLIPFPLLGHNRFHAWGLTMFANDDTDLYLERFHPEDPNKVMYKGEWVDVRTETETIKVRFGADVDYTVRVTPHGPVITDLYRLLTGYEGPDIALFWVWQNVEYTDVEAIYRMGHATDCDSFRDAVALLTSPGMNVSYADADGNIAWWAGGLIPIRPDHVNPKMLLDGASGKDEILGYLPFEQNPHLENPPWGYIVTANNKSTVKPVGLVQDLEGYWTPVDRAGRIEHLLETQEKWSIEELKAVQLDDTSYSAPAIVASLAQVLRDAIPALTDLQRQALETLETWDCRHNIESTGATIYHPLCDAVLAHTVQDEMGEDLYKLYATLNDSTHFFKHLVQDAHSPFWDDVTTEATETRSDIVLAAFDDTLGMLARRLGPDVSRWAWGTVHTMEFKHPFGYLPLFSKLFNIGPFAAPGGSHVINNMISWGARPPYDVIAGPSTRRIIDFGDPEHSLTILPTGNSGLLFSPHYDDQAEPFMTGQYREPRLTDAQIEAHKQHEMHFSPAT